MGMSGNRGSGTGGGSGGFVAASIPTDFNELYHWFRADGGTVWQDASATTAADTDGDAIALWQNEGTDGGTRSDKDAEQTTSGLRPVWRESVAGLNNKPAIEFRPANLEYLIMQGGFGSSWPSSGGGYGGSFFMVAMRNTDTPAPGQDGLCDFGGGSGGGSNALVPYNADGNVYLETMRDNQINVGASSEDYSQAHLITVLSNTAGNWTVRINQTEYYDNAHGSAFSLGFGTIGKVFGASYMDGYIAEFIIYADRKTSDDYLEIERYLNTKYGM